MKSQMKRESGPGIELDERFCLKSFSKFIEKLSNTLKPILKGDKHINSSH